MCNVQSLSCVRRSKNRKGAWTETMRQFSKLKFADYVRKTREARGLSLRQTAKKAGLPPRSLFRNWERRSATEPSTAGGMASWPISTRSFLPIHPCISSPLTTLMIAGKSWGKRLMKTQGGTGFSSRAQSTGNWVGSARSPSPSASHSAGKHETTGSGAKRLVALLMCDFELAT